MVWDTFLTDVSLVVSHILGCTTTHQCYDLGSFGVLGLVTSDTGAQVREDQAPACVQIAFAVTPPGPQPSWCFFCSINDVSDGFLSLQSMMLRSLRAMHWDLVDTNCVSSIRSSRGTVKDNLPHCVGPQDHSAMVSGTLSCLPRSTFNCQSRVVIRRPLDDLGCTCSLPRSLTKPTAFPRWAHFFAADSKCTDCICWSQSAPGCDATGSAPPPEPMELVICSWDPP